MAKKSHENHPTDGHKLKWKNRFAPNNNINNNNNDDSDNNNNKNDDDRVSDPDLDPHGSACFCPARAKW